MEGVQHHYARSRSYLYDVNAKSVRNKSITTSAPSALGSYEPPRERLQMTVSTTTTNKSKSTWWWNDAEKKRKRRVAKYKYYAAEGKFKHSVKKGFRWFKIKCIKFVTNL